MKQKKFDWGYFLKHIAIIAIPVALQNLLTTTGSMVDTIMLASIGEKAVGAVGLCAQFSSLMFSGYWGFIGGGMLFFAQYWGAKDHDGITRSYGMTLLFMITVALILQSEHLLLSWESTPTNLKFRRLVFLTLELLALRTHSKFCQWQ